MFSLEEMTHKYDVERDRRLELEKLNEALELEKIKIQKRLNQIESLVHYHRHWHKNMPCANGDRILWDGLKNG